MKVGIHAREPLDEIIARKTKEIEDTGVAFWGYGGNTCHPLTMVQPFAQTYEEKRGTIYLCMHEMVSNHWAEQVRADEYSKDGINWEEVPSGINVLGSRYALVIRDLKHQKLELDLSATKVALGNSMGLSGDKYIRGRVDKACLEVAAERRKGEEETSKIQIGLVAELVKPYAVYVRNKAA